MEPPVKRIGDVTIERVSSEKKSKTEDSSMIQYDTDTDSENDHHHLSEEESSEYIEHGENMDKQLGNPFTTLNPNIATSSNSQFLINQNIKRKNEFDIESNLIPTKSKKSKNENPLPPPEFDDNTTDDDDDDDDEYMNIESELNDKTISELNECAREIGDKNNTNTRTHIHSDNEDSEYDSEEDTDNDDAAPKLPSNLPVIVAEKTDFIEKLTSELGEPSCSKSDDGKIDTSDYNYDITEKLKEMGEISVETVKKGDKIRKPESTDDVENEISVTPAKKDSGSDSDDKNSSERKIGNMRRNIREVMDETQLDEATLAAQRQEMERLRRVQEQQRIIREVQRQIALNRQNNKTQHRVISLLQGNSSLIKHMPGTSGSSNASSSSSAAGASGMIPNASGTPAGRIGGTVLVKLPNGETKPMTRITKGSTPFEVVRLQKGAMQGKVQRNLIPLKKTSSGNLTPSVSIAPVAKKIEPKVGESDSESEPSDSEKKIRKVAGKQKDVVTISSSSDDDCIVLSEEEPEEPEPDEDPCNSGMHTNDAYNVPDEQGRVLINVGHPENEQGVYLAPQIARVIKPHQIGGVRFLFDNVIESVERFNTSTGFGCILAHSMGLGKTLQIVCFSDIFLRHTDAKTILCIMPINTLQNWMAEFNMWLPKEPANSPLLSHGEVRPRNFNLYVLNDSHKTLAARAKVIQEWHKGGGVLLIGYELYRLLSLRRNPKSKAKRKKPAGATVDRPDTPEDEEKNKSLFEEIHEALVKPGPDLVICDEGHRIKNSHASISQALKQIRSKRRIVLTGYPLQNNLLEYWCMVDFVRPNYLGTKTEFSNMFERPIQNGQCIDSTPQDIRLMRYRAHVLHSLLEGFVQRRSHAVLQTSLPQKEEYVLLVRMTEFQRKLYDTFMNEVVRTKTVPNPLKAFAVCCKIWNHPDVLYYFLKKHISGEAVDLDLEEVAGSTTSGSAPSTPATPKKGSSRSKGGAKKEKKVSANPKGATKKEKKTAASKANSSKSPKSTASSKPAASVTPNTTNTTTLSTTSNTTNPASSATLTNVPPSTISNAPNNDSPNMPPPPPTSNQNSQNFNEINSNYPPPNSTSYSNQQAPYQNYPQYPQNGDYYNQNQNYPNNYNPPYYSNQEYGGFYEGANKPDGGYMQPYQHDNQQNYWNSGGNNQQQQNQQYYNQNGPQGDYYGNQQQGGYGNQWQQNQYNQNYPQNNMYQPNQNPYQQNQGWQQQNTQQQQQPPPAQNPQQPPDIKQEFNPDFKSEFPPNFKQEFNTTIKQEIKDECMKSMESMLDLDANKIEEKFKTDNVDDEKKGMFSGEAGTSKEEIDEKDIEKNPEFSAANLAKIVKEDPGIPYDWAQELMKGYIPGCIENSAKMEIFFCILQESMALGDRILLFSQSLFTLNLIEEFLQRYEVPGTPDKWTKNKNYYRLDGSTSALEREKLINEYNSNPNIHLFLVSTRAGSLGINLVGANRVIVFDASWNPCHDTQAVCRVYRYGQKKPCFVYRIVMDNCLEKKIYDRQINKQGMADRVVDECNPDAHLSMKDVTNLCWDDEKDSEVKDFSTTKDKYIDVVMQKVLDAYSHRLSKEPFQHESLLIDRKEKKLSQAEKRLAKRSYELEKQANINSRPTYSYYNSGKSGSGQGLQIRAIRNQDGMLQNKPIASVRPMQSEQMVRDLGRPGGGAGQGRSRWIPAEVWQRQGMTAQEMTLPLDVVIPTNSPDRGSIVLKAGQKVLVLKSPKGIYMQLECGKIVAIKTAFKVRGGKAPEKGEEGAKEPNAPTTILKKVPQGPNTSKNVTNNVPLPLKNNTAITVIPKGGGQQRVVKPFTQGITKLNMRSIRQPVPNLISRQIPMRGGAGPRFTGKIQSIHRKIQLAKAKPYNLDKTNVINPNMIKNESTEREVDSQVVPSSDEEIPIDPQKETANQKGDENVEDCADLEQFQTNDIYSESEKSMENDMERLSNQDYPENSLDRRVSTESYQSPEKMSSSDSFTNLDQFNNSNESYQQQNPEPFRNPNSGHFQNIGKYSQPAPEIYRNTEFEPPLPPPQNQPDKFYNNPNTGSGPPQSPLEKYPNQSTTTNTTNPISNSGPPIPEMYPQQTERYPNIPQTPQQQSQQSPVYSTPDQYPNKFTNPTNNYPNTSTGFQNMDNYPKLPKPLPKPIDPPEKPIIEKPPKPVTNYPNISNPPLPIPSPVVVHEQSNTSRSLKNYRHNFASQKAHNQGIKPIPKPAPPTSSALHQLEQTTSSIGENKQAFQESLDSITNSYGASLPSNSEQKQTDDNNVIDLDADKSDNIIEKSNKVSSTKSSHMVSSHPVDLLKPAPPPHHHLPPSTNMKPEIQQQSHAQTPHHIQQQQPQPLPVQQQQQQQPPPPIQQHPVQSVHPPLHQIQHQPPHGHQQDFVGSYGGYYGYGAPHMQPYPIPPHQPYYNPGDAVPSYQEVNKSKIGSDKPPTSIVSQTSNITHSESIQSSAPSTPTLLPVPSALPTPAPITTPHHIPTSLPYGGPPNNPIIIAASTASNSSINNNVNTSITTAPSVPPNSLPPTSLPPGPSVVGTPVPTGGGFTTPYGQPGLPPPPPPHGSYDMMGYPQQGQYSANYPGIPYPNQPNYQPPYQPPGGQYDQGATAPSGPYPPAPGPPNMYSAFHPPQYTTDPYAQPPHYGPVRNAYPPQYGYPPPPGAQYGAGPAPAPGYEYQYNANGFPPPPPPFVNPYPGLPNNNPVP